MIVALSPIVAIAIVQWPSLENSTATQWLLGAGVAVVAAGIAAGFATLRDSRGSKVAVSARGGSIGRDMAGSATASKRTRLHESLLADGNTIDTRYRYQRLLYASMRPSQVAVVALAAAAPVAVAGLLIWTIFEPSARQAVGVYLIVASLAGVAAVWLATSPLYLGW